MDGYWNFVQCPNDDGYAAFGPLGQLMSPAEADELFEALERFFCAHGRENVQKFCDWQKECIRSDPAGIEAPSALQRFYPKKYYASVMAKKTKKHAPAPAPDLSGVVYILRADNGPCKIGRTRGFEKRYLQLTTRLPYDLEIVMLIGTDDCFALEEKLHSMFEDLRKKGEWFEVDSMNLGKVKEYALAWKGGR